MTLNLQSERFNRHIIILKKIKRKRQYTFYCRFLAIFAIGFDANPPHDHDLQRVASRKNRKIVNSQTYNIINLKEL